MACIRFALSVAAEIMISVGSMTPMVARVIA